MFSYSLNKAIYKYSCSCSMEFRFKLPYCHVSDIWVCEDRDESNLQKHTLVRSVIGWGLLCKFRHYQRGWLLANMTNIKGLLLAPTGALYVPISCNNFHSAQRQSVTTIALNRYNISINAIQQKKTRLNLIWASISIVSINQHLPASISTDQH